MATQTEKIIIQYETDIKQLKKDMKKVQDELTKTQKKSDKAAKDMKKGFSGLGSSLTKLAGIIGAAFTVREVIQFTKHIVQLAAEAQGVEAAFKRLDNGKLLDNLRKATRGTVDDLTLMKQAVRADNFKIPLDLLAKGLEFARRRAKETGEDVDFLVNSFVVGVGRKSVLVFDNLGVSVKEIQEEIRKTGDFATAVGVVMERAYEDVGDEVLTAKEKQDQLTATLRNQSKELGERLLPAWEKFLDIANEVTGTIIEDQNTLKFADDLEKAASAMAALYLDIPSDAFIRDENLSRATASFLKLRSGMREATEQEIELVEAYRLATEEYLSMEDALKKVREMRKDTGEQEEESVVNIKALKEELKLLEGVLENAEIGSEQFSFAQSEVLRVNKLINDALKTEHERREDIIKSAQKQAKQYDELQDALKEEQDMIDSMVEAENKRDERRRNEDADLQKLAETYEGFGDKMREMSTDEDIQKFFDDIFKLREKQEGAEDIFEQLFGFTGDEISDAFKKLSEEDIDGLNKKLAEIDSTFGKVGTAAQLSTSLITSGLQLAGVEAERFEKFQKIAAAFEIGLGIAKAIAQGTAVSQTVGFPANLAAIASTLAAVAASAVKAKQIFTSAGEAPKYSSGVIDLRGPGTSTSDSIPAWLSKGESVMTAEETRKHRDILQSIRNNKLDEYIEEKYGYDDSELRNTIKFGYKKADKNTNRIVNAILGKKYHVRW